jgi:quercetin dioxygenase-like cupin family protein
MPKEWVEGTRPPGFKGRSEVAILQGDPNRQGAPYVIRIRSTLGSQIPPHWTSDDETITVLSGTLCLAVGTKYDENACTDFPAGSFAFLPKGVAHFGLTKGDVVQIQGTGPLKVHWVEVHSQDTSK